MVIYATEENRKVEKGLSVLSKRSVVPSWAAGKAVRRHRNNPALGG